MAANFPSSSRYFDVETTTVTSADGTPVVYLKRRFVPGPERFELLQEHSVAQGDRIDVITATYLDDPEQFWRLCDGNGAIRPDELTEVVGRRLRITLPEGVKGPRSQ